MHGFARVRTHTQTHTRTHIHTYAYTRKQLIFTVHVFEFVYLCVPKKNENSFFGVTKAEWERETEKRIAI